MSGRDSIPRVTPCHATSAFCLLSAFLVIDASGSVNEIFFTVCIFVLAD